MNLPVAGPGPVGLAGSGHARFFPLLTGQMRVVGGYWAARQAVNRSVSIPSGYHSLESAGSLRNLELVAQGGAATEHRGPYFVDSDVYKWLEAVGWELGRVGPEDGGGADLLRSYADHAISLVQNAQAPDGYLNTWFQLRAPDARFTDLAAAHELYCAGHLFQAAVAWRRSLQDDRLLDVATRFADYIASIFGPGKRKGVPGHPEVEMALVELYRSTGPTRYLDLARFFIDERGYQILGTEHYGPRYRQDDVPFRQATEARGHCVRAAYLACGALDVSMESDDRPLLDAAVAQWEDMVARRMYLTGAVGSRHKDEAFGDPFELPPDRAYAETCAAIGVVMWSWRLLLATGEVRYADLIERVLFNAFAAGVSMDGTSYFYVNPLQVRAGHVDPDDGRGRAARSPWYEIACCPPNVMRTLSTLEHYFATNDSAGLQIWQFAPCHISLTVDGGPLDLVVDTGYPFADRIAVRVHRADVARPYEIALRVPGWSGGASGTASGAVRGDGQDDVVAHLEPGTLWRVTRTWRPGDELLLEVPMPVRTTRPHPRIDAVRGTLAFERGPLVYCVEEVDAGGPERLEALRAVPGVDVGVVSERIADEDVTVLEVTLAQKETTDHGTFPYATLPDGTFPDGTLPDSTFPDGTLPGSARAAPAPGPARERTRFVPYFAWGNRHPGQTMRVWVPEE
jgi:DUF1680 family protein